MAGQDWFEKDFYAVLGVDSDATADEVKKAYRKLARQHHPDANAGDPAAERRFKEVGEAYAVLADPEQRKQYDAVRAMSRGGARFTAGGPNGSAGGVEGLLRGPFGGGADPGGVPVPPPGARGGGRAHIPDPFRGPFGGGADPGGVRFPPPGAGGGAGANFEDLFGGLFGAGAGGSSDTGFRAPRGPRRGADLTAEVNLTFRQAVDGAQLSLRVADPLS